MKKKLSTTLVFGFLCLAFLVFVYPLFLATINSFKNLAQIIMSPLGFPVYLKFDNYARAFSAMRYPQAFLNTAYVSTLSVIVVCFFSATTAYLFVRNDWKFNKLVFSAMVVSMIIPFQAIMIPFIRIYGALGLLNSKELLIYLYFAFGTPMAVFMYHGFIKGVPVELEEAAVIEGCGRFQTFFYVVFPLLKATTSTIAILDMLWFWNDYLLPYLVLKSADNRTLSLATFYFYGTHTADYGLLLAALVMAAIPLIVLYLFLQKYIIRGIVQGASK